MRRLFLFTALVTVACVALSLVAGAADSAASEWGRGLDLTPAQQARVRQILRDASVEADRVDASAHLSVAERQARYAEIERDADRRLYATLTPSQKDRFRELHPDVAARLDESVAQPSSRVGGSLGEAVSGAPSTSPRAVERLPQETAEAPTASPPVVRQPSETRVEAPPHRPLPPPSLPQSTPPTAASAAPGPVFTFDMDEMSAGRAAARAGGAPLPNISQGLNGLTQAIFSLGIPALNSVMRWQPRGGAYPPRRVLRPRFRF